MTTLPSCPVSLKQRELMAELEKIRKQEEAEAEVKNQEEAEPDLHGDISGVRERVGAKIKKTGEQQ